MGPPLCNNSFVRHLIYVCVITDQEYQDVLHDVEPDVPQVHVTGGRVMEANRTTIHDRKSVDLDAARVKCRCGNTLHAVSHPRATTRSKPDLYHLSIV